MFKKLLNKIAMEGKSLLVWILNEVPGITDYPGLYEALQKLIAEPSVRSLLHALFQALWAGAAGHRLIKLIRSF